MVESLTPDARIPTDIRWTRDQCTELEKAGVLDYRYELIEGEIVRMSQNMPHATLLAVVWQWALETFGRKCVVSQPSIDVSPDDNPTSEPMPDIVVLNRPAREFDDRPKPADIQLLIEISDSTLQNDRVKKARLYARAGIVDYWVVDVKSQSITIHRVPRNGEYDAIETYSGSAMLTPLAAPQHSIQVSELLSDRE